MRIVVLHSDVAPDARPDELDTLVAAEAVSAALMRAGHQVRQVAFTADPEALRARLGEVDLVFNLVESVYGQDELAALAPALLERFGLPCTGAGAAAIALTSDKPATKRVLRAAALRTPDWAEAPHWQGLSPDRRYIVKSATADASLGLDAGAVVAGDGVRTRARSCAARYGGRWFAEAYVEGREFNIALLDTDQGPRVLPLAEMCFTNWDPDKPRIVDYAAKWDEGDADGARMIRSFETTRREPALAEALRAAACRAWNLFGLAGYARVDFRVGADGAPTILEINPNPCLEPGAGFAAAAKEAGYSHDGMVDAIARAALHG